MMKDAPQVLAQAAPGAAANTLLYTVPSGYGCVASIHICNRSAVATSYRIALVPRGGSVAVPAGNQNYIAYDTAIGGNAVARIDKLALEELCDVCVYCTLATVSFTLTGVLVDA
jgi:hypothetical protein